MQVILAFRQEIITKFQCVLTVLIRNRLGAAKLNKRSAMCIGLGVVCLIAASLKAKTVIKGGTLSFEKCLDVIATTSAQTAMEPRVTADRKHFKIVEYDLADGALLIFCDGRNSFPVSYRKIGARWN